MLEFGVVSHLAAAVAYGVLASFTACRYFRRSTDRALFLAATLTAVWAIGIATQNVWGWPDFALRYLTELTRNTAWIVVLFALIRDARTTAR